VGWQPRADGAVRVWRLPPEQVGRAFAPDLLDKAREAAGVRADVVTAADELRLDLEVTIPADREARLDVMVDGALHDRIDLAGGRSVSTVPLPSGEHRVQAWLPQVGEAWLHSLTLDADSEPTPAATTRWTTYGSSISQCSAAAGPAETWPAIVARALDWDLTCLGFGGQCHLDPLAVRTIEAIPADVVSLCLGINIQGGATLSGRTFAPLVADLLDRSRAAHPEATIVVITPIVSPPRESAPNAVGLDLVTMRETLAQVVAATPGVHLIDGPSIIGHDDVHLLPDELHPDPEGYRLMGERLTAALGPLAGR
jgi:hypothetical protein